MKCSISAISASAAVVSSAIILTLALLGSGLLQQVAMASEGLTVGCVPVEMTGYYNNDGISFEADTLDADMDGKFLGLPAEELPGSGSSVQFGDVVFTFPCKEDGVLNNMFAYGQTMQVPLGHYKAVHFLVTSVGGTQTMKLSAMYEDGTTAVSSLKVADISGAPGMKKYKVLTTVNSHGSFGVATKGLNVWGLSVPLNSAKRLQGLIFDEKPEIHIFATTLQTKE